MFCQIKTGVGNFISSIEQQRDIAKLQNAVQNEEWGQVNTLLGKEHCMKFFTDNTLQSDNVSHIYQLSCE